MLRKARQFFRNRRLIKELSRGTHNERANAAEELGTPANHAAVPALLKAACHEDFFTTDFHNIDQTKNTRIGAVRSILRIGPPFPADVVSVLSTRLEEDPNEEVKNELVIALIEIGTEPALDAIFKVVRGKDQGTTNRAFEQLAKRKPELVGTILQSLADGNAEGRYQAACQAYSLPAEVAAPLLARLIFDAEWKVRHAASQSVETHAKAVGFETVLEAYRKENDEHVRLRLDGALCSLRHLQDLSTYVTLLDDRVAHVRAHAIWALAEFRHPSSVPALSKFLFDKDEFIREITAKYLANVADPSALQVLLQGLKHHDPHVRRTTAQATHEIRTSVFDQCWPELLNESGRIREYAIHGLANSTNPKRSELITRIAKSDRHAPARHAAIRALGTLGGRDEVAALETILSDDIEFAQSAECALSTIGDQAAQKILAEYRAGRTKRLERLLGLTDLSDNGAIARKLLNLPSEQRKLVGEFLWENGGHQRMVYVAESLRSLGGNVRTLEGDWDGIGTFRA